MIVPFAPGALSRNSGPHEELPSSHVGRPHPSDPARRHRTGTVGDGTIVITGILNEIHWDADVLPERVKPKAEPTEES